MTADGLHIRWRETAPDRGVLDFALAQLDELHVRWPETVECKILIERAPCSAASASQRYRAQLVIELNCRGAAVKAGATGDDPYAAIRRAFGDLQNCLPCRAALVNTREVARVVAA